MRVHPFSLQSSHPPDECIRRLRGALRELTSYNLGDWGDAQFYGKVERDWLEVRKRRSLVWRNKFSPHLFAQLLPTSEGTRIEGYFSVNFWVPGRLKLGIVGLGVLVAFSFITVAMSSARGFKGAPIEIIVVPLALLGVGLLLPRIGYFMSHSHEVELLQFVKTTLEATELRDEKTPAE